MAEKLTQGRRLLRAVLQRTTAIAVAARCRVSQPTVTLWALGERNPNDGHRRKLEELYGIPPAAWGAVPRSCAREKTLYS